MSDLSRSLVDAAAEAIDNANVRGHHMKMFYAQQYAPLAVAAVLEKLAAEVESKNQPFELVDFSSHGEKYREGKQYVIALMRRLAVEARKETP